jgi:hypothetical protein
MASHSRAAPPARGHDVAVGHDDALERPLQDVLERVAAGQAIYGPRRPGHQWPRPRVALATSEADRTSVQLHHAAAKPVVAGKLERAAPRRSGKQGHAFAQYHRDHGHD